MKGRSIIRIKKMDYDLMVFQHLLCRFKEENVSLDEIRKLIFYLGERHVDKMSKRWGRLCLPRLDLMHKTPLIIKILPQIYQSMVEEY